jgi:hypothetical protein
MASDYEKIRNENIKEYGEGTRHLSFLGRLYTDRTHFIFELLQNAEDAGASRIFFRLFEDRLEVSHDGRLFNERDVRGICGVGEGTKADDLTQIGKFGIGFKSVYAYTINPEIHSGDESFIIENYVRPFPAKRRTIEKQYTTLFIFAFNRNEISGNTACDEIRSRLLNLNVRTLLFLRKIDKIVYKLPDQTSGIYMRETKTKGTARYVTVMVQSNGKGDYQEWLIFERPVKIPDKSARVKIEIAFQVTPKTKNSPATIKKIGVSPLVVYFPTEKDTRFGFLIQGPYRTTPSRDNVPHGDNWNKTLVLETAQLLSSVLPDLKKLGLLNVAALQALPIRMNEFPQDGMFYPIVDSIRKTLASKELLPADNGTFATAETAKLARGADLRNILNQDQLCLLFDSKTALHWLTDEITQDRTPDLRTYLLKELNIEEVTPESFSRKVTQSFLKSQSDDWFIKFYSYLSGQEALWRAPRWQGDAGGILREKDILRLQDDKLVSFQREDATPNAFLPPPEETDFPVIKQIFVENDRSIDFLKRLGLSEPDIFDDIVKNVLPKYKDVEALSISEQDHVSDIKRILRALRSNSESGKKKVILVAQNTPFLKSVNQNGRITFQKPKDVYFATQEIKEYFSGKTDVWFLNETEGEEEWRDVGVEDKPRFIKIIVEFSAEERRRLSGRNGEKTDYYLDGLDIFLSRVPNDKDGLCNYSVILWDFLLQHLEGKYRIQFYEGEYKWYYRTEKKASFEATWKRQICSTTWFPSIHDKHPHLPSEISVTDLPEKFKRNDKLAEILGMKKNAIAVLAEKAGLKVADIEVMLQHPEEFQQWKSKIITKKEKTAFPIKAVPNLDRRAEQIVGQFNESPEKEYEPRTRLIRITEATEYTRIWLKEHYTNNKGQMVCQICKDEMPFKKRNKEYYFESVEIFSKKYFNKEHEAQFLALCPLCAAMYKEFVKRDEPTMENLNVTIKNSDNLEIPLKLGEWETSLRFVESHWLDIKTILQEKC